MTESPYRVNDLVTRIVSLYNKYKCYIDKDNKEDLKIEIYNTLYEDNSMSFEIMLVKNNKYLDKFQLNFSSRERILYEYICLSSTAKIMKRIIMSLDDYQSHLSLFIEDRLLLEETENIIGLLNERRFKGVEDLLMAKYDCIDDEDRIIDDNIIKTINCSLAVSGKVKQRRVRNAKHRGFGKR